ncbi:MAG: Bax inhibitor-1 family protein [Pirellulaceae bacterium]|nr:Bax inhibitor-1 family protein [Pirellulaceae bacterium]
MSYQQGQAYDSVSRYQSAVAANAAEAERTSFIRRTYMHLTASVLLLVVIEFTIFSFVPAATLEKAVGVMFRGWNWLLVMGAFMMVSMIANKWAISARSYSKQYMGLGLYILAQALILVPLLFIAEKFGKPGTIGSAGVISGFVFTGLTMIVFFTRADLSWMRKALMLMSFVFLGMILCGILFEFHFGMLFSCLGIGLAGGYILYYTSHIMLRFHTDQHIVAALCLFAAVILLFWYILSLLMELQRR